MAQGHGRGIAIEHIAAGEDLLALVALRYRAALNAYFRRRVPLAHDCEDLTQEVLLRLVRRGCGETIQNVHPYVFQTAASVLVDHFRRRAIHGSALTESYEEERHALPDASAEQLMLGRERMGRLSAEIAALPDRARQAFILFRFEGMKQADIARLMGISVSAVEKHIKLGMVRLAAALVQSDG